MIDFEDLFGDDEPDDDWRTVTPIDIPDLPFTAPRMRYRPQAWWRVTAMEDEMLDYLDFETMEQRMRYTVARMARETINAIPGADDDTPLFEHNGETASLNDLLLALEPIVSAMLED